jgi:thiol-disulfide isomerase/thioredoxin
LHCQAGREGWIRVFVLESGIVHLDIDLDLVFLKHIGGTPVNDHLMTMLAVQNMNMDVNTYFKKMYEAVSHIVCNHPGHPLSPFLIEQCQMIFTPSKSIGLIEQLSPDVQSSPKIDRLKDNLWLAQETEEGKMFKELTGISPDGKPIAISDFVGKGQYVLADFWASWCAPCKADMPDIIALYEKYKDRGLKVIGITVSDTPEKSDSIVKTMGIPFPQIYESKPMSIYGITGIPHVILFAPDGTILSRRVVSSQELDKKLSQSFE